MMIMVIMVKIMILTDSGNDDHDCSRKCENDDDDFGDVKIIMIMIVYIITTIFIFCVFLLNV